MPIGSGMVIRKSNAVGWPLVDAKLAKMSFGYLKSASKASSEETPTVVSRILYSERVTAKLMRASMIAEKSNRISNIGFE